MAKAKSTDQIFNDMVQQEMANGGRSLNQQMAINRGREQYTPNPNGGRSQAMQDAIARGRALRAPAPAPVYDHPQFADDMRDFRNDTMYNFARDNGMAGNGQGFSSRDYLNAVDMFDKYMKGETNDTSWSDFFDKHGLKPISRSNLEKRYRASWDSDAGKGGGPVPTGEQQAIMQQVAQAQQGGVPQSPAQAQVNYTPSAEGSTDYYDVPQQKGSYPVMPNNPASDDQLNPNAEGGGDTLGAWIAAAAGGAAGKALADYSPTSEYGVARRLPPGVKVDFYQQPSKSVMVRGARDLSNYTVVPSASTGLGTAGLLVGAPAAAAAWGYANRDDQMARMKENFDNEDYYNNYNDFY